MYQLKTEASFDSAHFLYGYDGKCSNIHGHRWRIEVIVSQENLQNEGQCRDMVIDFGDLKKVVRNLANSYDHALIYEENTLKDETVKALKNENFDLIAVPFRPTAECFAEYFFRVLKNQKLSVKSVAVYETPENCAIYEE